MTLQAHDARSSYRPDIDGLRAVAVLAVVLFHINPLMLPGGFAGVDIFFVISGFLITGNIVKDTNSALGFSWREFYRRRALRILPVLSVVLLATLLVGHFVLLPDDLIKLSYSSLAAIFSAANIYFTYFLDTSYFADDSSLQPLLHLWSLGVEEQFYLFWPVLLVFMSARFSRGILLLCTLFLAGGSFFLAEGLLVSRPMFAYYMLPSRAGELLVGAVLAILLSADRADLPKWLAGVFGSLGACLIAFSLGWVTEDMGFPGINALPATVGAALLIWAGSASVVGVSRILALRAMVLIGLVSYSLYLWHWPVLAFYRYIYGVVEPLAGLLLFGLMLLLSLFSYHWVEKPCRHLRWNFTRVLMSVFVAGGAVISSLCVAIILTNGFGFYIFDSGYRARLKALEPSPAAYSYPYVCQRPQLTDAELNNKACVLHSDEEPSVLLWGDSNASHYVGMLGVFAEQGGFAFRNAAHSSCPPLLEGAAATQKADRVERCLASIAVVKTYLDRYSTIILGAHWSGYFSKDVDFAKNLERTVDALLAQGKHVIILGQAPSFKVVNRKCPQKALKLTVVECGGEGSERSKDREFVNRKLRELASSRSSVEFYDGAGLLCVGGRCSPYLNGELSYFDNSHLSMEGSWLLGRHIVKNTGVPDVFVRLGTTDSGTDVQIPLNKALLERGQAGFNLPDKHWSSLMSGEFGQRWRGPASRKEAGRLIDNRKDAFDIVRYSFSISELQALAKQGSSIQLRAQLSACTEGFPMMRILARAGGEQLQHDVMLDCQEGRFVAKGALNSMDVNLKMEGDIFTMQIRYRLPPDLDALDIVFYPAAGTSLGRYDASATGAVTVKDIALAITGE